MIVAKHINQWAIMQTCSREQSWWRHQMEKFSALLVLCAGNSPAPVNSPHKGQWRGALMFSLIYAWINGWVNNREDGDLRRHRAHFYVNVMVTYDLYRPLTIYVKLRVAHASEMLGTFLHHWYQRKPLVSDTGMHRGKCVMHVGSLNSESGEKVPGIFGACAALNSAYLVRRPW